MITKTVYKNREEWLEARNSKPVIGGSNISAILGIDEYTTPYDMWLRMTQPTIEEENSHKFRGRFMEDGIAQWFEQETGNKVIKRSAEISVYTNSDLPDFFQCAPDRELFAGDRSSRPILEIKDTRMYINLDNMDEIPLGWYTQLQFQMGIMGREYGFLVICDGNKTMQYRLIKFDKEYFDGIIAKATRWYSKYIIGDEQPPAINGDDVTAMYPDSTSGKSKRVGNDVFNMYERLRVIKASIKALEKEESEITEALKAQFDDSETLEYEGKPLATYKTFTRSNFNMGLFEAAHPDMKTCFTETTKYRRFSLK